MYHLGCFILLLHTSAALSEKWCECSSTKLGSCNGSCQDADIVGITNIFTNASIVAGQEEFTKMLAQYREISGNRYASTKPYNLKQDRPYCNGTINRFNYTCIRSVDIAAICSSNTVSFPLYGAIWTPAYPEPSVAATNMRTCTCNLHIQAKEFKVINHDYNLTNDQSLKFTFTNGSTYQDWNSPFNIYDVENRNSTLKNVNTNISLTWTNPNLDKELFFIGFEVTNGTVDLTCEKGSSFTPSTKHTSTTSESTSTQKPSTTSEPLSTTQTSGTSAHKQTTDSTGDVSSRAPTTATSKIATSTISLRSSPPTLDFDKTTAVGTHETSEQPEEKSGFPWYIIFVVALLLLIAIIVIIIVVIWKKKQKRKVEPSDERKDQSARDTVANTRAPAASFVKSVFNEKTTDSKDNHDEAITVDVLRTLPPLNQNQPTLTVCYDDENRGNEDQSDTATKKKKKKKRKKKHKHREQLDDNDVYGDQAGDETEEHLIELPKRRKRKKKHKEKKTDEDIDVDGNDG
ncbi:uncharacterized protein LOC128207016 [Mya arenaria]|uniref:uncharacterized protein LOC128207016 n=1 Tax=Mya arenaria TaxID=6604 RepID=UPI0022E9416F|nr:uncharacterized protein LOC128207016 [Mya arenaria]